VVPIFDRTGKPFAVLDIDSDKLNDFSDIDADGLEKIAALITGNVAH
jgi:GAF domain-containing protein